MGSMKVLLALCVVWCVCFRLVLELNSLFALLPALVLSVCLLACPCGCGHKPCGKGVAITNNKVYINGEFRGAFPAGSRLQIRSNDVYVNGVLFAKERA
jgi:hypothetical protein